jgi:hypothetical protein
MTAITTITAKIKTAKDDNAGTDGTVYLGIGGREFKISSSEPDFEKNSDTTYQLGEDLAGVGPVQVDDSDRNDPRKQMPLTVESLSNFPVWIRFAQTGNSSAWLLESVRVTVNPGQPSAVAYTALGGGSKQLWLGTNYGAYCFLSKAAVI